ncbi:Phosphate transporter [Sesamum angolense]|uniref:Phosphate transporter n=1 Tax=Sesamum angolense TaxID=2727404 RepID=A0AAE2BZF4_9LAMI|nr:Phosphate transporter [Sesamum angolense]
MKFGKDLKKQKGFSEDKEGDIENQVIAVDKVEQENSRNLYNSKLLVSPEDGEENESIFFKTLDDELNKTNSFYKDKVDEAIGEAALLKKQMEVLVALRIKVINPNFDGSSSLKCLSMDISNLAPSKIIPPARSKTVVQLNCAGIWEMDRELGVEMSSKSQLEPGSSSGDAVLILTTTKIESFPKEFGNPSMKSIEIQDHACLG